MNLFPAIDLLDGRVVRLRQGDYDDTTFYGDDPVQTALGFVAQGAAWVHMVDLDAARSGTGTNRAVIAAVAAALAGNASLQVGGGVRTIDDARELAGAGVNRVVMGSAAVANPGLVDDVAAVVPVAVGLDHRNGDVATHGWTKASGESLDSMLAGFPAASAFVITDISRDGMLAGPDVDGLARSAASTTVPVVASGGVGSLGDLRALAAVPGLAGVIVGKALYEGRFTVAEAVAVLG
jgi:phosphoribosylformimino-5-aminoimidazole carboxamide ribotide isomerase